MQDKISSEVDWRALPGRRELSAARRSLLWALLGLPLVIVGAVGEVNSHPDGEVWVA